MNFLQDLHTIAVESKRQTKALCDIDASLMLLFDKFDRLIAQLKRIADVVNPDPQDLNLVFTEEKVMATKVKMKPTSKGMKANMPPVKWSALSEAGGLEFELVDANGNPIPAPDPNEVTTGASSDDTSKTVVNAGPNSLSYQLSKPAGVSGQVVIAATLAYNDGHVGPFSATQPIILDEPEAADLFLKFTPD